MIVKHFCLNIFFLEFLSNFRLRLNNAMRNYKCHLQVTALNRGIHFQSLHMSAYNNTDYKIVLFNDVFLEFFSNLHVKISMCLCV